MYPILSEARVGGTMSYVASGGHPSHAWLTVGGELDSPAEGGAR